MRAFLLDEALALRLRVEGLNAMSTPHLPGGYVYEDVRDVPRRGPLAPGPAAHLFRESAHA